MQIFQIGSSIFGANAVSLHQLLKGFLGELSFRSRLAGYEMEHTSDNLRMVVESINEVRPHYNLNATFRGEEKAFVDWVDTLYATLNAADILYLLDWVEVDEQGNELGEEESLSTPNFDARYAAWREEA